MCKNGKYKFFEIFKVCKLAKIPIAFQFNTEVCSYRLYIFLFFKLCIFIVFDKEC